MIILENLALAAGLLKFPPCGLMYGDLRDQELTHLEGNRPFVTFWISVPLIFAFALFL